MSSTLPVVLLLAMHTLQAFAQNAPSAAQQEVQFWATIEATKNPPDYNVYLATYPNGVYVPLAKARIKAAEQQYLNRAHDGDTDLSSAQVELGSRLKNHLATDDLDARFAAARAKRTDAYRKLVGLLPRVAEYQYQLYKSLVDGEADGGGEAAVALQEAIRLDPANGWYQWSKAGELSKSNSRTDWEAAEKINRSLGSPGQPDKQLAGNARRNLLYNLVELGRCQEARAEVLKGGQTVEAVFGSSTIKWGNSPYSCPPGAK